MTKDTIRSRNVQSRSLNFHVLEAGEDRPGEDPVILLHGYPQTSHMWRHQMPVLGERFKVYAPDTRGYGGTDKPRTRLDRSILARDIIDLMDALDIESARIVGHDWGGIIASAAALKYPDRFSRLGLIDTLVSVWITWGIHGYWFKCEPDAEDFFKKHHRDFIRSTLGGEDTPYGGPPESPWAPVEGSEGSAALADWDPTQFWDASDVKHYEDAFSDPGSWFHAIEYYRHCLPFHVATPDASAPGGVRFDFRSNQQIASMWHHKGLIFSHPEWNDNFMVFAPEDWHLKFEKPTMYLFSPFLMPQAFVDGQLPADDYVPSGNAYADSFPHHFPDLRARGAQCGHFIPEEAPERTNELLMQFLTGEI